MDHILGMDIHMFRNVSIWDPPSQLGPLQGPWVPPGHLPTGEFQIPSAAPIFSYMPSKTANSEGSMVCRPAAGDTQTSPQITPLEQVDLKGDVENFDMRVAVQWRPQWEQRHIQELG